MRVLDQCDGDVRRLIPALLVLSVGVFAHAQRDPFDEYVASLDVLQIKAVQAELRVSDAQRTRMNGHADDFNRQAARIQTDVPESQRAEMIERAEAALKGKVLAELTDGQVKRLAQISLQKLGVIAILDPKVASRVGLSGAQSDKIAEAWNALGRAVGAELERVRRPVFERYRDRKPKDEAERRTIQDAFEKEIAEADKSVKPQLDKHRAAFEKAVADTLTTGQMKAWDDLKGPAFTEK
jgi:hypothetical protein